MGKDSANGISCFFACKNLKNNERELKKNAKEEKYKNNSSSDDIGVNMCINYICKNWK